MSNRPCVRSRGAPGLLAAAGRAAPAVVMD